jgi:hypothetical protein
MRPLEGMKLTLVDTNGIHETLVAFCDCGRDGSNVEQLIDSGFLPATADSPKTAFSFRFLREAQMLRLEAKCSIHHIASTLRRLTDNVFTEDIPVRCAIDQPLAPL